MNFDRSRIFCSGYPKIFNSFSNVFKFNFSNNVLLINETCEPVSSKHLAYTQELFVLILTLAVGNKTLRQL